MGVPRTHVLSEKPPCRRCGIPSWAEFCRDCVDVDPQFTAGGMSARDLAALRLASNDAEREYWRGLSSPTGRSSTSSRSAYNETRKAARQASEQSLAS